MKKVFIILFIFLLAFSIRLAHVHTNQQGIESDEVDYDNLAMRLLEKGEYAAADGTPTSYRPPFYPAFLTLIYSIFGHNIFIVRMIQIILSAMSVCLLYLTADRIFGRLAAFLTGIFSSFYMPFVMCSNRLYAETLFTFLLTVIIYLVVITDRFRIWRFCVLGFLCGILTLIKSSAFFTPLIIMLSLGIKMRRESPFVKKATIAGLALFLCFSSVLLPWTIRNYRVHHRLVLISTNLGVNLYVAARPAFGKIIGLGPRGDKVSIEGYKISGEIERNDFFIKEAFGVYKENPLESLKMLALRFLFFWNVIDWEIINGETVNYHFIFILPFAILGTVYAFKDRKDIFIISLVILYFSSQVLLFQGVPRYRMPIDGYIIILGSYGICEFINRRKHKIYPALYAGAYFLFTYLLYRFSAETKYFIKSLMEKVGLW